MSLSGECGMPEPTGGRFTHAANRGYAYRYLAAVPDGPGPWPLLLFLHGSDECGSDLELTKHHGPPQMVAKGWQFPFVVLTPQCPRGKSWSSEKLETLLGQAETTWHIDPNRIWVSGISMGGYGAWALALRCPWRLAALAPICGGGDARQAHLLRDLPIWAFHGAHDPIVPATESRHMVEAINQAGGKARLTVYPTLGHDCWTHTYAKHGFWTWLRAQTRLASGPQ